MSYPMIEIGDLMLKRNSSVDPSKFPDETFELHSIPAFDKGTPDIVKGSEIGSSKQLVQENDVMISKIVPHIRRASVVCPKGDYRQIASGEWIVFRSDKIYPDYLKHVLISDTFNKQYMATVSGVGGSLLRARPAFVAKIKIALPPLSEQRRIASILDQADELRQKRQQAIEKLDQLLQATFIDMFGDPVSNPKGWDLVNLESLLAKKLISGAYFPKETYVNSGGVPMVHMGDVFYGVVKPDNLKQVNISNEEVEKYKITNKDILIARRSLTYDGAAKACLVECSNQEMIFESSLIRLSPNLVKILPEFLYHYLNNNDVRNKFIIPYITKSTISGINQANLNKVTVLLPPLSKQEKFIEISDKFKQLGKTFTHDLNKLNELFKSLQNQAFNGTL